MPIRLLALVGLVSGLMARSAAAGEVHLVTFGGPSGYATLQEAVDAAASGDTILLRPSVLSAHVRHEGAEIRGKGLTLIGVIPREAVSHVRIQALHLVQIPLGETVALRNLELAPLAYAAQPPSSLRVTASAGAVRTEDCLISGQQYPQSFPELPAIDLQLALDVSLVECDVRGTSGGGIRASRSRVTVYDSTVHGGMGQGATSYTISDAGDGSPGVELLDRSFAWLGQTDVVGGLGGFADCLHNTSCTALSGDGGPGALIEAGSLCVELASTITGGEPGEIWPSAGSGSAIGQSGPSAIGTVQSVPGGQRILKGPRSVRSGESVSLRIEGLPGEEVVLFVATEGGHRYLGPLFGALLVNGGLVGAPLSLGVLPASGVLQATVDLPQAAHDAAETFQLQVLCRTAPTRYRLSPVRQVSVLGEGIRPIEPIARAYVDVNAPPGGSGLSWASAANNLREFVDELPVGGSAPTEIWLAEGVYRMVSAGGTGPLFLGAPVHFLGGFDGTETSADQRDPEQHRVVVTGDVLGDDATTGSRADNVAKLIVLNTATPGQGVLLSGVTVEGSQGGAALDIRGSLTVDRCRFFDNRGGTHDTGAVRSRLNIRSAERLVIRSSVFDRNGGTAGGAVEVACAGGPVVGSLPAGTPRVDVAGSLFLGNRASQIESVIGGETSRGGAISVECNELVSIVNNTFIDNDQPLPNSVRLSLGGVFVRLSTEVQFHNNVCASERVEVGMHPVTSAIQPGGGDHASFNRVEALLTGWSPATNTTADPLFVSRLGPDGVPRTGDEDLTLAAGSPCVDAGSSFRTPLDLLLDLARGLRFVNDPLAPDVGTGGTRIVDMGCYERQWRR